MANSVNITHEIDILFNTKLDKKHQEKVGQQIRNMLENAVISFDEADAKSQIQSIVHMMEQLFAKAEIAFDADKLLGKNSMDALRDLAAISADQFQDAFNKALAKSGGVKIDFGGMDLSSVIEPLERVANELTDITKKLSDTTKKSVSDIDKSLKRLKPAALEKTVSSIDKLLGNLDKTNFTSLSTDTTKVIDKLGRLRETYSKSVKGGAPWEKQYASLVTFVATFEQAQRKFGEGLFDDNPEIKDLYNLLSPKSNAAKIALADFSSLAKGGEMSEYKDQPWAREKTLAEIKDILKNGVPTKNSGNESGNDVDPKSDGAKESVPPKAEKKINVYRGIIPPEDEDYSSRREVLDSKDGSEWWATNKEAARTYADMDEGGVILVGQISPKNPLIIDAGGRNYDDYENMPGIRALAEQFPDLRGLIDSKADITDVQKYINTRAKELGHDVVQFDNVNDVLNPEAFKEIGSTFAVLNDNVLKVNGAFAQLKYDTEEGIGDYAKKASFDSIPGYYKMPQTEVNSAEINIDAANAAEAEANSKKTITKELEKQNKLLLVRRVEGDFDPNRISNRSNDALYDKQGRPNIQYALEDGFGGFGDGLFGSVYSAASDLIPKIPEGKLSFFEFDVSDYRLFVNKTAEQAETLRTFLLSLQKFVGSGSLLDTSQLTDIDDLSDDQLYEQAQLIFKNFSMTREQFDTWLNNAKIESEQIAELFKKGEVPSDKHNFATRFMKQLGYEGILNDTGDVGYDGNTYGSVIFDPDERLKKSVRQLEEPEVAALQVKAAQEEAQLTKEIVEKQRELTAEKDKQKQLDAGAKVDAEEELRLVKEQLEAERLARIEAEKQVKIDDVAQDGVKVTPTSTEGQQGVVINEEQLRSVLSAITYNVKVVADADTEPNGLAIDATELKSVLHDGTPYDIKNIGEESQTVNIDETALNNALANISQAIQSTSGDENAPWAREDTLKVTNTKFDGIKGVLDNIKSQGTTQPVSDVGNVLATESTLSAIKTAVESIDSKVIKGTKATTSGGSKTGVAQKNAESYDSSRYFPEKLKTQTMQLAKFRAQLMTTGKLTDDVDMQIYELLDGLKQVQNGPDFSAWMQKFQQLKTSVGITDIFDKAEGKAESASYQQLIEYQKLRNKLELEYEKAKDGSALKAFYAEQLSQMDGVITRQQEILDNAEYEAKLAKLREEQERKLGALEAKAADKATKDAEKRTIQLSRKQAMSGKASSAVGRAESTWLGALLLDDYDALPEDFKAKMASYHNELEKLRSEQFAIAHSDGVVSDEQQTELIKHTQEVNKLTDEYSQLIAEYNKLSGANVKENLGASTLSPDASVSDYEKALKQAVNTAFNGKAQIKDFNNETKTLTYTLKTGKNEFTTYTAAVRHLDNQMVSVAGNTKRAETFFEASTRKLKEISSYVSAMSVFSRFSQELRRGLQYVKEIDLALTELKKVTDETEAEYDQFLQTASKTADKLGSTISAVTEATATFAKLGYSMDMATEMAEAAIVYKNVGDNIASTEDAADSIISTLKGFGLEASESMGIVDRFNEVGEQYCPDYIVMCSQADNYIGQRPGMV